MTVGGHGHGTNTELYSLEEGQSIPGCLQNLQQLPRLIKFGSGAALGKGNWTEQKNPVSWLQGSFQLGFLEEAPHICGGTFPASSFPRLACYRYLPVSNEWVHSGNLAQAHGESGFTRHSQLGLVITGNSVADNSYKKSVTTLDGETMNVRSCELQLCVWVILLFIFHHFTSYFTPRSS